MSTTKATDPRRFGREELGIRETRQAPLSAFQLREIPNGTGGTQLRLNGYASTTCSDRNDRAHAYRMEDLIGEYDEYMLAGCFAKTLGGGADVSLLVNHEGVSMARTKSGTLRLAEDSTGLNVEALLNPQRPDVQVLRAAVEDGDLDSWSFAFRIVRQEWSYREQNGVIDRRYISEVNLNQGDVSVVNYPANPGTAGLIAMRNRSRGGRRASSESSNCNRCGGNGQITITCPQCLGLDASTVKDEQSGSLGFSVLDLPDYTIRARADLARARARQ